MQDSGYPNDSSGRNGRHHGDENQMYKRDKDARRQAGGSKSNRMKNSRDQANDKKGQRRPTTAREPPFQSPCEK
jgi:hypothetical protein